MKRPMIWLWLGLALSAASTRAAGGWAAIKDGITLEAVGSALGEPLIKSQSRGYDLWIYDHGGEVIASQGAVIGWTLPAAERTAKPAAATQKPAGPVAVPPRADAAERLPTAVEKDPAKRRDPRATA